MPTQTSRAGLDEVLDRDRNLRVLLARIVQDPHLADDVAQEIWLKVLCGTAANLFLQRSWLGTVARNHALQALRCEDRRRARERRAARSEVVPQELEGFSRELCEQATAAVAALEEPYRSTIQLRFFEDLPPTLIAERLQIPVETVRTRLKRALATLRSKIIAAE